MAGSTPGALGELLTAVRDKVFALSTIDWNRVPVIMVSMHDLRAGRDKCWKRALFGRQT